MNDNVHRRAALRPAVLHAAGVPGRQRGSRVWFPEDENGEPHDRNPDDGYGGAHFKLQVVILVPRIEDES